MDILSFAVQIKKWIGSYNQNQAICILVCVDIFVYENIYAQLMILLIKKYEFILETTVLLSMLCFIIMWCSKIKLNKFAKKSFLMTHVLSNTFYLRGRTHQNKKLHKEYFLWLILRILAELTIHQTEVFSFKYPDPMNI